MMQFQRIYDEKRLYEAIYVAFFGDNDLINRYHVVGGNLDDCVKDTFNKCIEASRLVPLEFFEVYIDEIKVGYTVMSRTYNNLYSFAINVQYRGNLALSEWFGIVTKLLNSEFTCALWTKNDRAIEFLKKHGMEIFEKDGAVTKLKYS
jgi:hypothetical protein